MNNFGMNWGPTANGLRTDMGSGGMPWSPSGPVDYSLGSGGMPGGLRPIDVGVYGAPSTVGINVPTPGMFGGAGVGPNAGPAGVGGGGMFDNFLSTPTQQGWGGMALGAASGLFNAWMGMKQYGLAKDQLAEGKRQFGLNYEAQRSTTNSQLEDRQRARVASNANAYQSVGDYMDKNSIKGG